MCTAPLVVEPEVPQARELFEGDLGPGEVGRGSQAESEHGEAACPL